MAPVGRPRKHWCNYCNNNFPSGRALGGHMSCNQHINEQPKSMPSAPAIVVDLQLSLLRPCDEKPLLPSLETRRESLREHIRNHGEKKIVVKPNEGAARLLEGLANAGGDHNVMVFPPVKRKRSKRVASALNLEVVDAAATLLLLSEHSGKTPAYEDCYGVDKGNSSFAHNVLQEVKLNAFDNQLVRSVELENRKIDNNSAYENCYGQFEKENNLVPSVPTKVELNAFDHRLVRNADLRKPRTDNSVKLMKSADLQAAVEVKRHVCNTCGKSFGSGQALGGHMRCHYALKGKHRQGAADF